jgi:omega-6 fatty acid desaturase (delta-12 desaturase)
MIQRDCGHGAFFSHRMANDWVGRVIGVLILTPYDFWRRKHAAHHASSGNLDRRGLGDVKTLTMREYLARSECCAAAAGGPGSAPWRPILLLRS